MKVQCQSLNRKQHVYVHLRKWLSAGSSLLTGELVKIKNEGSDCEEFCYEHQAVMKGKLEEDLEETT